MSAAMIEAPSTATRTGSITRTRQLRPGRGGGRGTRPVSRSMAGVAAPALVGHTRPRPDARSCRPEYRRPAPITAAAADAVSAGWRLTNRGIAVVLITGALLVAAAVTVITATAITVTSDDYHPHGSALAHR